MSDFPDFHKQSQTNKTYSLRVSCANCGFNGIVHIPKGRDLSGQNCPECDCKTLVRKN